MSKPTKNKVELSGAQHQASLSTESLQALIHGLPSPVVITNRSDARILMTNKAAIKVFGKSGTAFVGESTLELGLWPSPLFRANVLALLEKDGLVIDYPVVFKDLHKNNRPSLISMTPILLDGRSALITSVNLLTSEDAQTEAIKEAEARLQCRMESQKMEALGHLAAALAHDFNNILASIMLRLELLNLETEPSEPLASAIDELGAEAKRAAQITRQLLLFSRRESAIRKAIDLNQLLFSMQERLVQLVCPKILVEIKIEDSPVWINGDTELIEQTLFHLVTNARDAMREGGTITLQLSLIPLPDKHPKLPPLAVPGSYACLMVADHGHGIQESVKAHLFEPFYTTKSPGKGNGMGLAIAYGLVQQHGGWITVDSKPERGSVFSVFLPTIAKAHEKGEKNNAFKAKDKRTLLLVEDDPSVLSLSSLVLQQQGHRVLEATSGREGLLLWSQHNAEIDLVVVDLILPDGVLGLDLINTVTSTHPHHPAILLGHFESINCTTFELPANCLYLRKPFDSKTLLEFVQTALASR